MNNRNWDNLSPEEQEEILLGNLKIDANFLTIGFLRETLRIMLNERADDKEAIDKIYSFIKTEMAVPSPRFYSDDDAALVNDKYSLDIDDTKTIEETIQYTENSSTLNLEIFKSVEELIAEYQETLSKIETMKLPNYTEAVLQVASLYEGAIHNYRKKEAIRKNSLSIPSELIDKLDALFKAKTKYPNRLAEIDSLITKLYFVTELYSRDRTSEHVFDILSKSENLLFESIMGEPAKRAEADINEILNNENQEEIDKWHEDAKKFAGYKEDDKYDLSSKSVITDYSNEEIDLSKSTIASRVYNIALANGQRVDEKDPVLVAAFEDRVAKLRKEMKGYSRKRVAAFKKIYGMNWEETYIENYTIGWNTGIKHSIDKAYDSAQEVRKTNIEKVEAEFSYNGTLDAETLESVANYVHNIETKDPTEVIIKKALVTMSLERDANNLAGFRKARDIVYSVSDHILEGNKGLNKQEQDAFFNNLTDLQRAAINIKALAISKNDKARKQLVEKIKTEVNPPALEEENNRQR